MIAFSPGALRQLLGPKPTRADYATVMIAGPLGLIVDGLVTLHGLPSPGTAGLATATFALGIKRSSSWKMTGRRPLKRAVAEARELERALELWQKQEPNLSSSDREKLAQCRSALKTVVLLGDQNALSVDSIQGKVVAVRSLLLKLDATKISPVPTQRARVSTSP